MLAIILNVFYVIIAVAMSILILLQRGAGAQAGSGFGAGASGTVFGARGAANFLSKSTKWLGTAFFVLTLVMAWMHVHGSHAVQTGVMSGSVMGEAAPAKQVAPGAAQASQPVIPQAPAAATAPAATQEPGKKAPQSP